MRYWQSGAALTGLIIVVLLVGCELLARVFPRARRIGLPLAIVAGSLGLLLSDQALGLFSLDTELLESLVYHGLAIVFIAVALRSPSQGGRSADARGMAFAIVLIFATQALLGLGVVLALDHTLHPGVGLLLPLGFEEGPGQALSTGAVWEESGLIDGAQLGLIIAVIGYAWSVFAGIPLVIWGRYKGWVSEPPSTTLTAADERVHAADSEPGSLDLLTTQIGLVGLAYLLTWALCGLLDYLLTLAGMPDIGAVMWGFHFIFGAIVAMALRPLLARVPGGSPIDDHLMGRVAGVVVDVITCAALAAVQVHVLQTHWFMILIVTTVGGVWTLWFSLWMARRVWSEAPFEHTVLFFGMSTGTLPTGLALLKVIDPHLRSPAAVSAVFGSGGAIPGIAILLMGLLPMTVAGFPGRWPGHGFTMLGALAGFSLLVFVLWWFIGGLRLRRPLLSLSPPELKSLVSARD
jgi:ESS family glutamate:Na+ symporter